ncbi:MAG: DUF6279 family lipoprotein [Rubrivivax sp.]
MKRVSISRPTRAVDPRIIGRRWAPNPPLRLLWAASLALLVTLGAGCSSVRLSYNNASQLTWWWLDGYVDFSREQTPAVRQGIDSFYAWHRATQLPAYVALLAPLQDQMLAPTTAAEVCRLQDRFGPAAQPSVDRVLHLVAERLPLLTEAQLSRIRERYDKGNIDARNDYLQPDPKRRQQAAIKRTVERAERLYGPLDAAQLALLGEGVSASPIDADRWLQARTRRQDQTLATLRQLQSAGNSPERRLALLQTLAAGFENPTDPAERAYQARLREHNCGVYARLHNSATANQRLHARDTLKGWEDDLRALSVSS